MEVMRACGLKMIIFFASLSVINLYAAQISVDETLSLKDLADRSTYVLVVSHAPPKKPFVSDVSVVHLRVHQILRSLEEKPADTIQVVHFLDDLLQTFRKNQKISPRKSIAVHGYRSPFSLEEALKKRFIIFLVYRDSHFHFVAPGSFELVERREIIEKMLHHQP